MPTLVEVEIEEMVGVEETVMVSTMVPVDYYEEYTDPHCECRTEWHEHVVDETGVGI